jgi:hypothetical protein
MRLQLPVSCNNENGKFQTLRANAGFALEYVDDLLFVKDTIAHYLFVTCVKTWQV